jgi:site-specific DNA recombinase
VQPQVHRLHGLQPAGTPIGKSKKGSRTSDQPNSHPATTRTYRLRSYVICELCGRRLYGKTRRASSGYSYYACEAVPAHHAGKDWFATHPKSLWVREDKLLGLVRDFFSRRILGPDRDALLTASQADEPVIEDATAARAAALRAKIRDLERQQANVVKELRDYRPTDDEDIDQQWRGQLRESFAEIAAQRKDLEVQLADLAGRPEAPTMGDPRLLDRLPVIETDLGRLPEDIERELFDGFQLKVRYHQPTRPGDPAGHHRWRGHPETDHSKPGDHAKDRGRLPQKHRKTPDSKGRRGSKKLFPCRSCPRGYHYL